MLYLRASVLVVLPFSSSDVVTELSSASALLLDELTVSPCEFFNFRQVSPSQ